MKSVKKVISEFSNNKTTLLLDDISNCSYLIHPAQSINNEHVSFIVNNSKGIVFVAICSDKVKKLGLNYLVKNSTSSLKNMTVSVEARYGVSTGISCQDRATTLNVIANTKDPKQDIVTPGHIFPVSSKTGGVLVKSSVTESAVDLCKLAKLEPACAYSQCLNQDGEILDTEGSIELAKNLNLSYCTISSIVNYRLNQEGIVYLDHERIIDQESNLKLHTFKSKVDNNSTHYALTLNQNTFSNKESVLVRVISEETINDIFEIDKGRRKNKLSNAISEIKKNNSGALLYIKHPRRDANNLQSDLLRELGIGAQILRTLGINSIKLLTNSTKELDGIKAFGIAIEQKINV